MQKDRTAFWRLDIFIIEANNHNNVVEVIFAPQSLCVAIVRERNLFIVVVVYWVVVPGVIGFQALNL